MASCSTGPRCSSGMVPVSESLFHRLVFPSAISSTRSVSIPGDGGHVAGWGLPSFAVSAHVVGVGLDAERSTMRLDFSLPMGGSRGERRGERVGQRFEDAVSVVVVTVRSGRRRLCAAGRFRCNSSRHAGSRPRRRLHRLLNERGVDQGRTILASSTNMLKPGYRQIELDLVVGVARLDEEPGRLRWTSCGRFFLRRSRSGGAVVDAAEAGEFAASMAGTSVVLPAWPCPIRARLRRLAPAYLHGLSPSGAREQRRPERSGQVGQPDITCETLELHRGWGGLKGGQALPRRRFPFTNFASG